MDGPTEEVDVEAGVLDTPTGGVFRPPSVDVSQVQSGQSFTHYSPIPAVVEADSTAEYVLGIDEAGRGPVLGPMVYAVFYLPAAQERPLLAETHHFDDSKVLTPAVRSSLMEKLCTSGSDLHEQCGWATTALSAQSISSSMLRPAVHNLNAQAMDATADLIRGVLARGVNITHVFVDTIGQPAFYQKKLERLFPSLRITVAKKADSLYPCVSAASVCAKVTRDAALEMNLEAIGRSAAAGALAGDWGSGYPSDARCTAWLKRNMDPFFGWGNECRFSWGTVKELLDGKNAVKLDWPEHEEGSLLKDMFGAAGLQSREEGHELANWYGARVGVGML